MYGCIIVLYFLYIIIYTDIASMTVKQNFFCIWFFYLFFLFCNINLPKRNSYSWNKLHGMFFLCVFSPRSNFPHYMLNFRSGLPYKMTMASLSRNDHSNKITHILQKTCVRIKMILIDSHGYGIQHEPMPYLSLP